MKKDKYSFEYGDEKYTLRDAIELFALGICESIAKDEQKTNNVLQKCKILDSLSNALNSVSK